MAFIFDSPIFFLNRYIVCYLILSLFIQKIYWFYGSPGKESGKIKQLNPLLDGQLSIQNCGEYHELIMTNIQQSQEGVYTCVFEKNGLYLDYSTEVNVISK